MLFSFNAALTVDIIMLILLFRIKKISSINGRQI